MGFFNIVGIPLFKTMVELFEDAQPMLDGVLTNFRHWEAGTADVWPAQTNPEGQFRASLKMDFVDARAYWKGLWHADCFLSSSSGGSNGSRLQVPTAYSPFFVWSADKLFSSSFKFLLTGFSFFLWAVPDETCTQTGWTMETLGTPLSNWLLLVWVCCWDSCHLHSNHFF